jgi:hypothetical protein
MSDSRRDEFLKRLSTVGMGARESIQVMLGAIVYDVREQTMRKEFADDEMDTVIAFHDQAEQLWRDMMATDPPLSASDMVEGLRQLHAACVGPLAHFERKLARGVEHAKNFAAQHADS